MTKRILLGGIVGGLILFIWGFLSHAVLKLGDAGLQSVPSDQSDALIAASKAAFKESGFYFFPHFDHAAWAKLPADQKKAAWDAYGEKVKSGPSGKVIYMAGNSQIQTPGQLGREFATDVVVALILAFVLSQLNDRTRYSCRVCCCATLGFLSSVAVNVPQWNWYEFPTKFTVAQVADHTIGFTLIGLFLAWLIKPAPAAAASATAAS